VHRRALRLAGAVLAHGEGMKDTRDTMAAAGIALHVVKY
jgi:hypothetical protein